MRADRDEHAVVLVGLQPGSRRLHRWGGNRKVKDIATFDARWKTRGRLAIASPSSGTATYYAFLAHGRGGRVKNQNGATQRADAGPRWQVDNGETVVGATGWTVMW